MGDTKESSTEVVRQPSFYVKCCGLDNVGCLTDDIPNSSEHGLRKLRKNNPKKYEAFILGLIAKKFNISIEDMLYLSSIKKRG